MKKLWGLFAGVGLLVVAVGFVLGSDVDGSGSYAYETCPSRVMCNDTFIFPYVTTSATVVRPGEPFEIVLSVRNRSDVMTNFPRQDWTIHPVISSADPIDFTQQPPGDTFVIPPGGQIEITWTAIPGQTGESLMLIEGFDPGVTWNVNVQVAETFGLSVAAARNVFYAGFFIGFGLLFLAVLLWRQNSPRLKKSRLLLSFIVVPLAWAAGWYWILMMDFIVMLILDAALVAVLLVWIWLGETIRASRTRFAQGSLAALAIVFIGIAIPYLVLFITNIDYPSTLLLGLLVFGGAALVSAPLGGLAGVILGRIAGRTSTNGKAATVAAIAGGLLIGVMTLVLLGVLFFMSPCPFLGGC